MSMETLTLPSSLPEFTLQEEACLRSYSETLSRLAAMLSSGLASPDALDIGTPAYHAALARAGEIIARAEHMPLSTIASAIGADRIFFLAKLKWVCENENGHIALKGLMLLGRILGAYDDFDRRNRPKRGLRLGEPRGPRQPRQVGGLPFAVDAAETDAANQAPS